MFKKIILITLGLLSVATGVVLYKYNTGTYSVNGVEVESLQVLDNYINKYSEERGVFADDNLDSMFIKYEVDTSSLKSLSSFDKFTSKLNNKNFTLPLSYKIDTQSLKSYISEYNKTRTDAEDAKIVKGKKHYKIKSESNGTKIVYEKVLEAAKSDKQINIDDYFIEPKIKSTDLQERCDELNKFVDWSIKYKGKDLTLKSSIDYVTYDSKTDKVTLNSDFILDFVTNKLAPKYNTVGITRKFKTHSGKKIKVSGGTFGSYIDSTAEIKKLTALFNKSKSEKSRKPIYSLHLKSIGKTYIEVNKSAQHLWVYKNGKCVKDTPIVTGQPNKGRGTPSGIFYISERIGGKYLTGNGYRTWVNRWMRLTNTGVGLHDATWRGNFGGSIYLSNGSHGCINLPKSFAYWLFDHSYVYEAVIVY